ncbi:hypothetical protein VNO78_11211 [Psophocarpus tetragonolobus]|uniref:Uncharacterized protein n=1 Tax=Psophocarpus tetragonolobus TaxID=3891 RepID=A0AAN9XMY6_PSOTE
MGANVAEILFSLKNICSFAIAFYDSFPVLSMFLYHYLHFFVDESFLVFVQCRILDLLQELCTKQWRLLQRKFVESIEHKIVLIEKLVPSSNGKHPQFAQHDNQDNFYARKGRNFNATIYLMFPQTWLTYTLHTL